MTTSDRVNISNDTVKTGTDFGNNFTDVLAFIPDDAVNNPVTVFPKASPLSFGNFNYYRQDDTKFGARFIAMGNANDFVYIGPQANSPV